MFIFSLSCQGKWTKIERTPWCCLSPSLHIHKCVAHSYVVSLRKSHQLSLSTKLSLASPHLWLYYQWKTIVFCSLFVYETSVGSIFDLWFEFFPSYRSGQKGTEGKFFEAEAAFLRPRPQAEAEKWTGRGWEMFPEVPFCPLR